ncbi:Putative aconitase subunit 1 [Desulfurococcus amylolyticus 1221n]|uniref:Phosphomevalonate dehydratase large subunit n=1 Tax=Desulfurococcus amylolyticus (strain DSM 18924 / JCM 16383 / VKM B-2413 / 1221n) TaxID=490899 RepID=B8D2S5_DESA1|nr:aconitase X catalytic domain-containing protein [Desulfurococcus amylolyticus]ACL10472.1 Putative aconitase subunit 1 [Desulfurococcus amylolyticus 1221n]
MYLTPEQEAMLKGEYGWSTAKAMEIIVKVGESLGAENLVKIVHAHISGVSFSNIGEHGTRFIRDFYEKGGRARVYTTINPGCVDYSGLQSIIDNSLINAQKDIDNALVKMGFNPVFTCIPYWYRPPSPGEHLAWGESSAVIFANTFYGGYTNREGGPIALAAAITGYTYNAGLHLSENRRATVLVTTAPDIDRQVIGAVGLWIGDNIREISVIPFAKHLTFPELKILLASMAASGSHAMSVVPGLTPRGTYIEEIGEKIVVEKNDIDKYIGDEYPRGSLVLGYVGCPHTTLMELMEVARLLERYGSPRKGRLLLTIPVEYTERYRLLINRLKSKGVEIAAGTCPVVSRLRRKYDVVVTNSGKAAFYLRKIHGLKVRITGLREVIESVYA